MLGLKLQLKGLAQFTDLDITVIERCDRFVYRLERIKEVAQLDLEDSKNPLELEMGLKMLHLVDTQV